MSTIARKSDASALSVVLPMLLLAAVAAALAAKTGLIGRSDPAAAWLVPQTVVIAPRVITYRSDGDFSKGGLAVDGPLLTVSVTEPLEIMKYHVSVADYGLCVADGVCVAAEHHAEDAGDVPVTGVNYDDATAYADWLSRKTGQVWRLPTDRQWVFAAGARFLDDALGVDPNSTNPALRWLADYEREAARSASRNPLPQPRGRFGENELGVADMAGNIWEWTTTCHRRVVMDAAGGTQSESQACGIYLTQGKHRSPMSSFIRDPKSGGCSVGTPPDNLGFRLVRDNRWYAPVLHAFATRAGWGG